ncbi:hypothetical protein TVAG_436450 [Trichomonas vaginalis G3]|uniref:Uncharacterized protein n=1 Tax=Trichomonas vaginalis (strain ATCC PRA-98 / G3) TaxID=412133 RepID=A2DF93_TRIV3|nr:hypothetical protein TVAGG3_0565840 [Trichomonas vaginalis G3]EAY20821.1 hypothetical protein TVAG_436450 [Trichomonas vaginalis G3]KAI5521571.1 hypothetical protein TVAGG3_0565840 [Trichomonas vaginalis G3]|eukprot:XP_001581807.1 hypothetical protein [Trichomonas vaginalis G3]
MEDKQNISDKLTDNVKSQIPNIVSDSKQENIQNKPKSDNDPKILQINLQINDTPKQDNEIVNANQIKETKTNDDTNEEKVTDFSQVIKPEQNNEKKNEKQVKMPKMPPSPPPSLQVQDKPQTAPRRHTPSPLSSNINNSSQQNQEKQISQPVKSEVTTYNDVDLKSESKNSSSSDIRVTEPKYKVEDDIPKEIEKSPIISNDENYNFDKSDKFITYVKSESEKLTIFDDDETIDVPKLNIHSPGNRNNRHLSSHKSLPQDMEKTVIESELSEPRSARVAWTRALLNASPLAEVPVPHSARKRMSLDPIAVYQKMKNAKSDIDIDPQMQPVKYRQKFFRRDKGFMMTMNSLKTTALPRLFPPSEFSDADSEHSRNDIDYFYSLKRNRRSPTPPVVCKHALQIKPDKINKRPKTSDRKNNSKALMDKTSLDYQEINELYGRGHHELQPIMESSSVYSDYDEEISPSTQKINKRKTHTAIYTYYTVESRKNNGNRLVDSLIIQPYKVHHQEIEKSPHAKIVVPSKKSSRK